MFHDLLSLGQNPVFGGMAGAAVLGFLLVQIKSLPSKLWDLFLYQFTVTLTLSNESNTFRVFEKWFAEHPHARRSRKVTVVEWHDPHLEQDEAALTPGPGVHFIREGGRIFLIDRHVQENSSAAYSARRQETLKITALGRDIAVIQTLLDRARDAEDLSDRIPVFVWGVGQFKLVERRRKRPMETIYLPEDIKQVIVDDLTLFYSRREWYAQRAIPWRRGYILTGPPGTGKSSMILALASLFGKSVNIINPSNIKSDAGLMDAMNAAGTGIVVIEDIDAFRISHDRKPCVPDEVLPAPPGALTDGPQTTEGYVTQSGLLNAIDGLTSREGRVLIITSNHPEKLDPALLRPGRIDMQLLLAPIGEPEIRTMYARFHPGSDPQPFLDTVADSLPLPASNIQNRLLGWPEDTKLSSIPT